MSPGIRGFLLFVALGVMGFAATFINDKPGPCFAWTLGAAMIGWLSVPAWRALQRADEANASPRQASPGSTLPSAASTPRKA